MLIRDLELVRDRLTPTDSWVQNIIYGKRHPETGFVDQFVYPKEANCWCLVGAIEASVPLPNRPKVREAIREIIGPVSIPYWNDQPGRTHAEVLELLDKVISDARAAS